MTSGENLFYFRHGAVGTCVRGREEASPCRNGLRRRELARRSQAAVTAKDRVGAIRTTLADGRHVAVVRGVYTYRSNGDGKLATLRAFWEFDAAELTDA